jgi:hypothetical protein
VEVLMCSYRMPAQQLRRNDRVPELLDELEVVGAVYPRDDGFLLRRKHQSVPACLISGHGAVGEYRPSMSCAASAAGSSVESPMAAVPGGWFGTVS